MAKRIGVVRPAWGWFGLLDGGIIALTVLSSSAAAHQTVSRSSPLPLPPRPALRKLLVATAAIHLAEAVAAGRMARRRGLPRRGWVAQTFVVGFPSLRALRATTVGATPD
jgi:hypothetical protein